MQSLNKIVEEQWKAELTNLLKTISDYNLNRRLVDNSNFEYWQKPPLESVKSLLNHQFFSIDTVLFFSENVEQFF